MKPETDHLINEIMRKQIDQRMKNVAFREGYDAAPDAENPYVRDEALINESMDLLTKKDKTDAEWNRYSFVVHAIGATDCGCWETGALFKRRGITLPSA